MPPEAVTVTVVLLPLQGIGGALAVADNAGGSVIFTFAEPPHPLASVTVNVWLPAGRLNTPVPTYGGVPPVAVTVIVEVPPLQRMGVDVALTTGALLAITVADTCVVQPLASVTVN